MDPALLAQLRADLEHDRDDLVATLDGLGKGGDDPLTEMLTASLADLRRALEKLDAGTYGTCEACDRPVGELRLRSLPAARLCLRCEGVLTDDAPA